jgi:5,10-methylenetetrahydrofolate reductase
MDEHTARSRTELLRILDQLRTFGVDEALVIAGDLLKPTGEFRSALNC